MESPKRTHERKKAAFNGSATYTSTYKKEWEVIYPITEANGNKYVFYCIPCKRNITSHHMGLGHVKQHCRNPHHTTMEYFHGIFNQNLS